MAVLFARGNAMFPQWHGFGPWPGRGQMNDALTALLPAPSETFKFLPTIPVYNFDQITPQTQYATNGNCRLQVAIKI